MLGRDGSQCAENGTHSMGQANPVGSTPTWVYSQSLLQADCFTEHAIGLRGGWGSRTHGNGLTLSPTTSTVPIPSQRGHPPPRQFLQVTRNRS
jgi:hypothetical protein